MVIAFGGALSLSRVLWKSAYSRSNMKPKSIPKQARKWIEQLFCWFQVLRQHFMFLSCCFHLHACSFIYLSLCIHFLLFFLSCSFHWYSCPLIFLSYSFHFIPFMSFHFLPKVMQMALWLGQATECNKWLSLSYR